MLLKVLFDIKQCLRFDLEITSHLQLPQEREFQGPLRHQDLQSKKDHATFKDVPKSTTFHSEGFVNFDGESVATEEGDFHELCVK